MSASREKILRLGALILAAFVSFLVCELLVRIISNRKPIYGIEMVKYAKELKIHDPQKSPFHVHRPSSSAKLMGVEVRTNSIGNRSGELPEAGNGNGLRILVFGNSMTLGWGVPAENVFTALAERELSRFAQRPVDVANAGVGNYNLKAQVSLLDYQFPRIRPGYVVFQYFIDDLEDREKGNDQWILRNSYFTCLAYERFRLFLTGLGGRGGDLFSYYNDFYQDQNPLWREMLANFKRLKQKLDKERVPMVVMIVPDLHDLSPASPFGKIYAKTEAALAGLGIQSINLFAPFSKQYGGHEQDSWVSGGDPHPNSGAHAIMSDSLVKYIEGGRFLDSAQRPKH